MHFVARSLEMKSAVVSTISVGVLGLVIPAGASSQRANYPIKNSV